MKMKVIGVTGGLSTGKTTVARFFAELGAEVLDADEVAHWVMRPGTRSWKEIVSSFGNDVLCEDQSIDREKLAEIVFSDEEALKVLEGVVHPVVVDEIKARLSQIEKEEDVASVVVDAPLLIEVGLNEIVDELVVVKLDPDLQNERAVASGLTRDQAIKRIRYQMPSAKKIELADYVVDNGGSLDQTRRQVEKIWEEIFTKSKIKNKKLNTHIKNTKT